MGTWAWKTDLAVIRGGPRPYILLLAAANCAKFQYRPTPPVWKWDSVYRTAQQLHSRTVQREKAAVEYGYSMDLFLHSKCTVLTTAAQVLFDGYLLTVLVCHILAD